MRYLLMLLLLWAIPVQAQWSDPQPVEITGYSGDVLDPFVLEDKLFWNDRGNGSQFGGQLNIHWASNDGDWVYEGVVFGSAYALDSFEGQVTVDGAANPFARVYYTLPALAADGQHIASGGWVQYGPPWPRGALHFVKRLPGDFANTLPNSFTAHPEISPDGNLLLYTQSTLTDLGQREMNIAIAVRGSSGFEPGDPAILENINTTAPETSPSMSNSTLELFFLRLIDGGGFRIMHATRSAVDQPFDMPVVIDAIPPGVVQIGGPAISGDTLYYHRRVGSGVELAMIKRLPE